MNKIIKLSIRNVLCDIVVDNNVMYITDLDINRVINNKQRSTRGKQISRYKLADHDNAIHTAKTILFPLEMKHIDDCYHNRQSLSN